MARMAGSDTSSSYVMEGMVSYLLDTMEHHFLKKSLNFYFLPMTNIDSAKFGNSVTNLAGCDLSSHWKNPNPVYQSETFNIKKFISEVNK